MYKKYLLLYEFGIRCTHNKQKDEVYYENK